MTNRSRYQTAYSRVFLISTTPATDGPKALRSADELVLALGQRELRSQLHVDHHANVAVQLKEGQVLFDQSGSRIVDLSEVRRILLVTGQNFVASLSARVKFAAMSCFLIERISLRNSANCWSANASALPAAARAGSEDASWAATLGPLNTHTPINASTTNAIFYTVFPLLRYQAQSPIAEPARKFRRPWARRRTVATCLPTALPWHGCKMLRRQGDAGS
jgi:hypothetical protein